MNHKLLLCLALVLIGVVAATMAEAQPGGGSTYHSIEARIVEAPLVLRGTVTNLTPKSLPYPGNSILTVRVDEALKGGFKDKVLEFSVPGWQDYEQWATRRASLLWFLDVSGKLLNADYPCWLNVIPLGPSLPGGEWDGISKEIRGTPVYDMEMTIVDKQQDILARALAFAKKRPTAAKLHSIYLPQQSTSDHYFFQSELVVPVEPTLEKTTRHLIAKPDDFITTNRESSMVPQWRCDYRADGASALQYFKSAANIKLLKSLLNAPDYWVSFPNYKIYSVRQTSYEVLRGWGVDVPKPVTEETVPKN